MRDEEKPTATDAQKKRKTESAKINAAIDAVLRTEEGRTLFVLLFKLANYNQIVSAIDPRNAEIIPASSAYNDGRRSLYVDLRKRAAFDLLQAAEALAERPPEENQ